jgi:hypothetical protein
LELIIWKWFGSSKGISSKDNLQKNGATDECGIWEMHMGLVGYILADETRGMGKSFMDCVIFCVMG